MKHRDIRSVADGLPSNVRRWVLHGGAVPDAVWFGEYSYLKQPTTDGITWKRTEFCEQLAALLKALIEQEPAQ